MQLPGQRNANDPTAFCQFGVAFNAPFCFSFGRSRSTAIATSPDIGRKITSFIGNRFDGSFEPVTCTLVIDFEIATVPWIVPEPIAASMCTLAVCEIRAKSPTWISSDFTKKMVGASSALAGRVRSVMSWSVIRPGMMPRSMLPILVSYFAESASTSLSFTRSYGNVACSANTNTTSASAMYPRIRSAMRGRRPS